jgi:hypothetical protein
MVHTEFFVGNPEGKILLGRHRRGWKGIIEEWMKVSTYSGWGSVASFCI